MRVVCVVGILLLLLAIVSGNCRVAFFLLFLFVCFSSTFYIQARLWMMGQMHLGSRVVCIPAMLARLVSHVPMLRNFWDVELQTRELWVSWLQSDLSMMFPVLLAQSQVVELQLLYFLRL